ncbi:DUF362 domain-containing protein, partial [bacterium]|nr:DUF362 domain-containing protein [bacterium]
GGIGTYVKKGQTVVVKPNMAWDKTPEYAANTRPELVARIVEHCYEAGAKTVYVFDHTCDPASKSYKASGIEKAAKDAGAKVAPAHDEKYFHPVEIANGLKLKNASVHELILESDVFINVPVLKNHRSGRVTISMKNMMGAIWDRGHWHKTDLHQCIADFWTSSRIPDLNIVDGFNMMTQNGPKGVSVEDVVNLKALLISTDPVAVDTAAAKFLGIDPMQVPHLRMAADLKVGRMDLENLNIKKIKLG